MNFAKRYTALHNNYDHVSFPIQSERYLTFAIQIKKVKIEEKKQKLIGNIKLYF